MINFRNLLLTYNRFRSPVEILVPILKQSTYILQLLLASLGNRVLAYDHTFIL